MKLRPVDGGRRYYGRFSHGLPTRASFFPIGVWFEGFTSQAEVNKDKDVGLNTYVVLTANSKLSLLRRNKMKALLQYQEWSPNAVGPETSGWEMNDEVDMEMSSTGAYAELQRIKRLLPKDRRLRYNNFGKGVVFWHTDAEAARLVNAVDLVSTDVYWFTDDDACQESQGGVLLFRRRPRPLTPAECHRASNYGAQTQRVRKLVSRNGGRPVWTFVELGGGITPPQVRAAVLHSVIAGARGVIYFNHEFEGRCQSQHILRDPCYASIRQAVKALNGRIRSLAQVLNAPTVTSRWSHSAATRAMVKWRGHFYVFAGSAENTSSTGSFAIPCVGNARATVIGEKRAIPVRAGRFTDSFRDGNAVHIYRIDGGSGCGLR